MPKRKRDFVEGSDKEFPFVKLYVVDGCTCWLCERGRAIRKGQEALENGRQEFFEYATKVEDQLTAVYTDRIGNSADRKATPLYSGCISYFPDALLAVAQLSKAGNDKHNPGQPLHWSRGKSNDHLDCIARHLVDAGAVDEEDGIRHSVKLAWRALANLQVELEKLKGKKA